VLTTTVTDELSPVSGTVVLALPLTDLSRTARSEVDPGVFTRWMMDPDLDDRTPADLADDRHETTDQKVGGSSPSERATYAQFRVISSVVRGGPSAFLGLCLSSAGAGLGQRPA